ncbi:MAG TPA: DUF1015 domain-containing protein [Gaiellaceae bacterium]|jgi:uncharacterized protein (DUF1015 family)|nr:DUF1015 domain-containing protein [Gaiellaceae bacterium]
MAVVKPFRAVRYDEEAAGPLESLVAPPYDVISPSERDEYRSRSPYNVVHLTLPDSADDAARAWREWLDSGVLVEEEHPAVWELEQDFPGPDGYKRTRRGLVASLRPEPYENGAVLPHERTDAGPKEERLRILRAVGAQLEPILLLHEGPPPVTVTGPPDFQVDGIRLRRAGPIDVEHVFADRQLLIADGHHRYETALEAGMDIPVVLVSTSDPGLVIQPTHRIAGRAGSARGSEIERPGDQLPGVVLYRDGRYELLEGDGLDVEVVERAGPQDVRYTSSREEAEAAVDRGEAEAAYLVRPASVADVFERARRGEVMPQKTTYFSPKLVSGLLFHPLD